MNPSFRVDYAAPSALAWLDTSPFERLRELAHELANGSLPAKLDFTDRDVCEASRTGPAERLYAVFLGALKVAAAQRSNAGSSPSLGNLYTDAIDEGSMIRAYEVLASRMPMVEFAYSSANRTLLAACSQVDRVKIVDVGIGGGQQWFDFLTRLAQSSALPREIDLIGIDVPPEHQTANRRLSAVGRSLEDFAGTLEIPLKFTAISSRIEELDFERLSAPSTPLVVNALLALHHTPSGDAVARECASRPQVLRRFKALAPQCLMVVETDSEHDSLGFEDRFVEALHHFAFVFDALESVLPRDLPERRTLENAFFGREIVNIVAGEKCQRVERHQRRARWQASFRDAGFIPFLPSGPDLASSPGPLFSVEPDGETLVLRYRGRPLLAAMAFR